MAFPLPGCPLERAVKTAAIKGPGAGFYTSMKGSSCFNGITLRHSALLNWSLVCVSTKARREGRDNVNIRRFVPPILNPGSHSYDVVVFFVGTLN